MFCKNCGKELPDESSFCPYCMTKFTKEIPVQPIQKKKTFNKKIIIIAVAIIVVIALTVSGIFIAQKSGEDESPDTTAGAESTTVSGEKISAEKIKSPKDDTSLGFAMLQTHTTASDLESNQKLLLDYFGGDYFYLAYESLEENHAYLKNAKVHFVGTVKEVIKKKNNSYKALVEYNAKQEFDEVTYHTGNYAVIECTCKDFEILPGQTLRFFAVFKGLEKNSLNGEKTDIPAFDVTNVRNYNPTDTSKYSKDELTPVAQYIFGKNTTLRQSSNDDFDFLTDDFYEDVSAKYFVSELFHLNNSEFQKYAFYNNENGFLVDCKTEIGINKHFVIAADFEHFYVLTASFHTNSLTFDCYDKTFKKQWSREFSETPYFVGDYTENYIYLSAGEKLYIIDAETGKDAVQPKTVGEKISIRKLTDGILMVSAYSYNAIVKTDLEGNELWKITTGREAYSASVQLLKNNYVIQKGDVDDFGFPSEYMTTVVTPDGNMVVNKTEF